MKKKYELILLFLSLFVITGLFIYINNFRTQDVEGASKTYYVAPSPTGSDTYPGSAIGPFRTLKKCHDMAAAGDICSVAAGAYNERLTVNKAMTFMCSTKWSCIFQGATLTGGATLNGFYSLNSSEYGGAIIMEGSGNIARDNKIESACMVGIVLDGTNNLAENNDISRSRVCVVSGHSGFDADGMRFFGSNQTMRGNFIHDIYYDTTVNLDPHIDCFQTWNGATDAVIENNICDVYSSNSVRGTQGVELDTAVGTKIRNNVFHTYAKKIDLDVNNSNTTIENNIFLGGPKSSSTTGQYGVFSASGINTMVNNNIFYNIRAVADGSTPWIYNATSQANNLPLDATANRPVNPGVDPKLDATFHPLTGSPACTGGTGGTYIGAYPCVTGTPTVTVTPTNTTTPTVTTTPTISITPTPSVTPYPSSLTNVYFTFAKFRYNKYVSSADLRAGDMAYIKNFNTNQLRLLQVFLYDYEKKGNQGYTKSKVTTSSMFLRTDYLLPTGKRYAYVMKFQDKATGIIATKYFVVYTTKIWLGQSTL